MLSVVEHNVTPKLNKERGKKKTQMRVSKGDRKTLAINMAMKTAWRLVDHGKTVRNLLLVHTIIPVLVIIGADPLILLEAIVVEEGGVIWVFTHTKRRSSDAVQRVHVIRDRTGVLSLGTRGGHRARGAGVLDPGRGKCHLGGARLAQIDVGRQLGDFTLGFKETRLQVDDIFAQLVILADQGLNLVLEGVDILHLFFELADIGFLALAECALLWGSTKYSKYGIKRTYLSSTVLGSALGSGQLTLSVALGATVGWGRALGLCGSLGRAEHGTRDGGVNVWLVTRASIVGLQVLLLARSTLRATAEVVLSS